MYVDPKIIDHTNLDENATEEDITKLCVEAIKYGFGAVCVRPNYVSYAYKFFKSIREPGVKVCTVIGFPEGNKTSEHKIEEAKEAIDKGADELDMAININELKNKNYDYITNEISEIKRIAKNRVLKVIIETGVLNDEQKRKACQLAQKAGADFVKTSTGFQKDASGNTLGATIDDIKLIKEEVNNKLGIKASGGIKSLYFAHQLVNAGATRIGASASIDIISVNPSDIKNINHRLNYEFTWDYFEFHADQRLRAFYYYLVIVGALAFGYLTALKGPNLEYLVPFVTGFGFFISIAFLFLEMRNVELVNIGRIQLRRLGFEIFNNEYEEQYLKSVGKKLALLRPFIKHELCLRFIYLIVASMALYGFLIHFKWLQKLQTFINKIDFVFWTPILLLTISIVVVITFWRRKNHH